MYLYISSVLEGSEMMMMMVSRDNGVVESDEADECDEIVLVSDGSEASNSSSVRGTLEPNGCDSSASKGATSGSDSVSVSTNYASLTAT
ncbi:hypothetical protein Tco_0613482 [Tanacetum coccineum]